MLDQSRASAPISTSSSTSRVGLAMPPVIISLCQVRIRPGRNLTATDELVIHADVEGCIGGRCEGLTHFTDDVLRTTVVIAHGILDLGSVSDTLLRTGDLDQDTYVHVHALTVALGTANDGSHND